MYKSIDLWVAISWGGGKNSTPALFASWPYRHMNFLSNNGFWKPKFDWLKFFEKFAKCVKIIVKFIQAGRTNGLINKKNLYFFSSEKWINEMKKGDHDSPKRITDWSKTLKFKRQKPEAQKFTLAYEIFPLYKVLVSI